MKHFMSFFCLFVIYLFDWVSPLLLYTCHERILEPDFWVWVRVTWCVDWIIAAILAEAIVFKPNDR